MNVKQITRALHTLSLLSGEDYDLVLKLRALTEDERMMLLTVLEPSKPAGKKATTKTTRTYVRCTQCDKTKGHAFHKDSSNDGHHVFQSPPSSKSSQSSTKSPRATGIEQQLNKRREQGRAEATDDDSDSDNQERCTVVRGDLGGTTCALLPDHNVHHMASVRGFHPFVASPTAPTVPTRSPANGGATSSTQNLEAEKVVVGAATGGSND